MESSKNGFFLLWLTIIGTTALLTLGGCAQNAPYHTEAGVPGNCLENQDDEKCARAYYQEHKDYDLAFVEFSDRGNAFDDSYVNNVLDRVSEKVNKDGAVIVTFVHGWKHNASEEDGNVISFKQTLQDIRNELKKSFSAIPSLEKRRLIGLYVGWRGATTKIPLIENLTFWDRKAAAQEVGKGSVTTLLLRLNQILEESEQGGIPDNNVLVVVGHSFGGAIVASAFSEVLTERVVKRDRRTQVARTVMDGVIVLNAALEATQVLPLVEAAVEKPYRPDQRPIFVSISSDADKATHYTFPIGQTLGLLLTWRQADLKRGYLRDRKDPAPQNTLREEHLDTTTFANFAPFLTHRLTSSEKTTDTDFEYTPCSQDPEGCKPMGLTSLSGYPFIETPEHYPLYFIKTDASVMKSHNDIFNQKVRAFLITLINEVVINELASVQTRSLGVDRRPKQSILSSPKELTEKMQKQYREISPDKQP